MDRRSVLKLFGIGAVIAPVIRGVATADQAVIVKPPEVELVKAAEIVSAGELPNFGESEAIMFFRDHASGKVGQYEIRSCFVTSLSQISDITRFSLGAEFLPKIVEMHVTITAKPVIFTPGLDWQAAYVPGRFRSPSGVDFPISSNYQGTRLRPAGGRG